MHNDYEERLNNLLDEIHRLFNEISHGVTEFDDTGIREPDKKRIQELAEKARSSREDKKKVNSNTENETLLINFESENEEAETESNNEKIGRMYEEYVGHKYENAGWQVEYNGINKGLEDGGIDLICTKGEWVLLIQCKMWAKDKIIHEKYIHQFFGSVSDYRTSLSKGTRVSAAFYTSASFSERAKEAAKKFHITLKKGFYFHECDSE